MRVYISVDMEGVAGGSKKIRPIPPSPGMREYNRMRRLMTSETNPATEGTCTTIIGRSFGRGGRCTTWLVPA